MADNFPKINDRYQPESRSSENTKQDKYNTQRHTARHIIFKLLKTKDKENLESNGWVGRPHWLYKAQA